MTKTLNDYYHDIDNLPIYKKDFNIIQNLLNSGNPKLFATIIEAIIDGELLWSDFERVLIGTNYEKILKETLETQDKVSLEFSRMVALKNRLSQTVEEWDLPTIAISGDNFESDAKDKEIYDIEYKNIRDNLLYEITRITENDNELSILCKMRLYSYLTNYNESESNTSASLSPDDIFLFINDFLIPVDYRYMTLDSTDIYFMKENNLTEDEMKKYKSLAYFLRRNDFNKEEEDE